MIRRRRASRLVTILFALLTAAFSAALLGYLVYREREVLLNHTWTITWWPLLPAALLFGAGLLLATLIWADVMAAFGSRLSRRLHIRFYCLSHLAKRLPGTIWYVVGRGYLYRQEGESARLVTVASGVELAVLVVSGAFVSLIFLAGSVLSFRRSELWVLLVLLALGLGLMHPRVLRLLLTRLSMTAVPWRYGRVVGWVVLNALIWISGGVLLFFFANTVYPVGWTYLPYVVGVWSLIGVLSVTVLLLPSNLGFTEVGLSLLLGQVMPGPFAVIVALIARLLLIVLDLIWAGLIMLAVRDGRGILPPVSDAPVPDAKWAANSEPDSARNGSPNGP